MFGPSTASFAEAQRRRCGVGWQRQPWSMGRWRVVMVDCARRERSRGTNPGWNPEGRNDGYAETAFSATREHTRSLTTIRADRTSMTSASPTKMLDDNTAATDRCAAQVGGSCFPRGGCEPACALRSRA